MTGTRDSLLASWLRDPLAFVEQAFDWGKGEFAGVGVPRPWQAQVRVAVCGGVSKKNRSKFSQQTASRTRRSGLHIVVRASARFGSQIRLRGRRGAESVGIRRPQLVGDQHMPPVAPGGNWPESSACQARGWPTLFDARATPPVSLQGCIRAGGLFTETAARHGL